MARDAELERLREALQDERRSRSRLEGQLKMMSVYLPIIIWMTGPDDEVTFVSRNWFDLTGAHVMDLNGWMEAVDPAQRGAVAVEMTRRTRRRQPLSMELRLRRADGTFATLLNIGAPCFDADGGYNGYVGAMIDVSERRIALDSLQDAEARLSSALEGTNIGVWDWDIGSGDVWLSESALTIQKFGAGDVTTNTAQFPDYLHPDDAADFRRRIRACLKGETPLFSSEHRLRCKDGGWVWILERGRVVERDDSGRAIRMIGTRSDMTERRQAEEHIRWLAAHDVLTELPNRARFQELLDHGLDEALRSGSELGLLFIDLDLFKQVNDTGGHSAGDALLKRAADRLRGAFPAPAVVARLGGDEFAVILPEIASRAALKEQAERALAQDVSDAGHLGTTLSVGAACCPGDADNTRDLLRHADVALYRAKAEGRARAVLYDPNFS